MTDQKPPAAANVGQRIIVWIIVVIIGAAAYFAVDWFFGGL